MDTISTIPVNIATPVNLRSLDPKDFVPIYEKPKPVQKADRIQTVDMIRGFALLGILLMNIPVFGIDWSMFRAILEGSKTNPDYITLATIFTFFDGTMRGLFSMLFGAGMVLFTLNKKDSPTGVTVSDFYYRRLLWLVLFGVINAYVFLWQGDILFYYGIIGMVLYPFRNTKPKWLLVIGFSLLTIGTLKQISWYGETREKRAAYKEAIAAEKAKKPLTDKQNEAKGAWLEIEKNQKPDPEKTQTNIRKMHGDYGTVFAHLLPRNSENETWGVYHGLYDMAGMMFLGMALLFLGFFSNKLSTNTYSLSLLFGYGLGIPIGWIFFSRGVANTNFTAYVDAFRVPHWALYDVRRVLLCLGHASLLMLIYRSRIVPWLMKGLSNVGQMAFTNYLMQSIICSFFFFGYGLDNYNNLRFYQLYYVVGAVWIFQLIFSAIWLQFFRFGPFEWLWRSVTYWKAQPMRIRENV